MRASFAFFKIRFNEAIQYKTSAIAGVITQLVWGCMYIMLYSAFMKNGNSTGMSVHQMSTYMWLQQAFIIMMSLWRIDEDIFEDIRNGNIAMQLVKPINIYNMWYARIFGKKLAMAILRMVPMIIIASLPFWGEYSLIIQTNPMILLLSIISLIFSIALIMSYIMLMMSATLILISDEGIKILFRLTLEFFSGSVIPIDFMPTQFVQFIKFTPFYYMQNMSYNIYSGYYSDIHTILISFVMQIVWIIILTILSRNIIKNRLKKIVVQGG